MKHRVKSLEPIMQKKITYLRGIEVEESIEIVRHCFFSDVEMKFLERIVRNVAEFQNAYHDMLKYWNYERYLEEAYAATQNKVSKYYGVCEVCNAPQPLVVDYQSADVREGREVPNWRERLVCPNCGCNNRQRFIIRTVFENYRLGMNVLLYEQVSSVFQRIKEEIPTVEGFEYFGEGFVSGAVYDHVIYQNICDMTYPDESFDLVISNDVFEHVYDYERAFREACRVLKKRGKLIFTVPFNANNSKTELRTVSDEVKISYFLESVFHDKLVEKRPPLLVYQIFGWDILDLLEKCGFSDAYAKVYYGMKEGYLGYLPMYFEAYK